MTLKRFIQEFIRAFLLGVVIFLIFGFIRYLNGFSFKFNTNLLDDFINNQIFSVVLYMVNMVLLYYVLNRFGKRLFQPRNLLIAMTGCVIVSSVAIFLLYISFFTLKYDKTLEEAIRLQSFADFRESLIICIVATGLFYAFYYYKSKQESKVKEQKIIAGTASAQFDALKNQLDPHFLFNSLNVLTSLIHENPDQAERFTTSLSKVYRYVLEQKNKELVTVDEELKFAQLYMSLLKMRFEDSIVVDIPEKSYNPEAKVVPLSLQLLLENAVKHNMVTPSKKLHIKIFERDGVLIVQNNLQPKQVVKKSSGVGLQNIKQRYGLLTDREVKINQTARDFAVAIPMLTKQTAVMKTQETYLEDKKYLRVKERVKAIKEFYIHFSIYLIMIPFFIWINWISTSFPWAIFPIVGWGIGVAGHAMEAFNYNPILGKNWEKRKIEQFMGDDDF